MDKNIIFLQDLESGDIDAVFITKTTTAEQLQEIIRDVKNEHPSEYCWEDIVEALPDDCIAYECWTHEIIVY